MLSEGIEKWNLRCKMEALLQRAKRKSARNIAQGQINSMTNRYLSHRHSMALAKFVRFMSWNTRAYLRVVGRAWNIWVISHHENRIQKATEAIIV